MRKFTRTHPLRSLRDILGKSRPQFGALVGCTQHAIKRIENGRLRLSRKLAMRVMQATGASWWELVKGPEARLVDVRGAPYSRQAFERWTRQHADGCQPLLMLGKDRNWRTFNLNLKEQRQKEIMDLLKWAEILLGAAEERARLPQVKQSLIDWLTKSRLEFKLGDTIDRDLRQRTFKESVSVRVGDLRQCKPFARLYEFRDKGQSDDQVVTLSKTFWPVWCPGAEAPAGEAERTNSR